MGQRVRQEARVGPGDAPDHDELDRTPDRTFEARVQSLAACPAVVAEFRQDVDVRAGAILTARDRTKDGCRTHVALGTQDLAEAKRRIRLLAEAFRKDGRRITENLDF